jgi:hypothetical protein
MNGRHYDIRINSYQKQEHSETRRKSPGKHIRKQVTGMLSTTRLIPLLLAFLLVLSQLSMSVAMADEPVLPDSGSTVTPDESSAPAAGQGQAYAPEEFTQTEDGSSEPEDVFPITVTQSANGTLTVSADSAPGGETIYIYAAPDEGAGLIIGSISVLTNTQNAIRTVRGSGTEDDPYCFTMPNGSGVTISAQFMPYVHVSLENDGVYEHGSISVDKNIGVKGDLIKITVTPDDGYRLKFNSTLNNPRKSIDFSAATKAKNIKYGQGEPGGSPYSPVAISIPDYFTIEGVRIDLNIEATEYYFYLPNEDVELTAAFTKAYMISNAERNADNPTEIRAVFGESGWASVSRIKAGAGEFVSLYANQNTTNKGWGLVSGTLGATDLSTDGPVVGIDADGKEIGFTVNLGFIMPESDVKVVAEWEEVPTTLDGMDLTATAADSEVVFTWVVHTTYASYTINYRPKGSEDAYRTSGYYTGGYGIGSIYTATLSNLENGIEYEFYLSYQQLETGLVYATPTGIPPTGISMFRNELTMPVGETATLFAAILPADTKSKKIIWHSENPEIATVDENSGMVTAVTSGEVDIIAQSAVNADLKQTCSVNVVATVADYRGRLEIGAVSTEYDESGGHVSLPVTVVVPRAAPVVRAIFDIAVPSTRTYVDGVGYVYLENQYKVNSISYKGQVLVQGDNVIDGINIKMDRANRPSANGTSMYSPPTNIGWACITSATETFLMPGATYEFELEVELLPSAPSTISIGFGSTANNRGFFCWSYQSPTSPGQIYNAALISGSINAEWQGDEPVLASTGYQLTSARDLMWYAERWNAAEKNEDGAYLFAGNAVMTKDIDLTGENFPGIGTAERPYTANFAGNTYSVTYMRSASSDGAIGFINYMAAGSVRDLTTRGSISITAGDVCVGGMIGKIEPAGYINSNCYNYVDITVTGSAGGYVGGFIGYATTSATQNVVYNYGANYGDIVATGSGVIAVGGHIGAYIGSNGNIGAYEVSDNYGDITGRGYVGGIAGLVSYNATATGKNVGRNKNYGTVIALDGEAAGGIAGKIVNAHIGGSYNGAPRTDGNYNYGAVTANTQYVGGIAGYVDDQGSQFITLNYNEGDLIAQSSGSVVGGVIGCLTGSETLIFANNVNKGNITGGTTKGAVLAFVTNLVEANAYDNWYAEAEGLSDAAFAKSAPREFLTEQGWSPAYSNAGGDGTAENPFLITNIYDFLWFTNQVNNQSGGTPDSAPGINYSVKLTADIDLSAYPAYEGIGTVWGSYPLQTWHGIFDGDGHTITLALDASAIGSKSDSAALFRTIGGATIKNLRIEGTVQSRPNSGSAVGVALMCDGTVFINVINYADITAAQGAAGIANGRPEVLEDVHNYGNIKGADAAGLANSMYGVGYIKNCNNSGSILGVGRAAGIVSMVSGGDKSKDRLPSFFVDGVVNNGNVHQSASAYTEGNNPFGAEPKTHNLAAAGIIAMVEGVIIDVRNTVNNGNITGNGNNIGGIIGVAQHTYGGNDGDNFTDTDVRISHSTNNGAVSSTYNGDDSTHLSQISVGGIMGNPGGDYDATIKTPGLAENTRITDCINTGQVSGPVGSNVGTIVGTPVESNGGKNVFDNNYSTTEPVGGGKDWSDYPNAGGEYSNGQDNVTIIDSVDDLVVGDDGRLQVKVPTTPEIPNPPVDPEDPEEPVDPEDPVDPVDPGAPGNPVDPGTPSNPSNPSNPVDPASPNNLSDLQQPQVPAPDQVTPQPQSQSAVELPDSETAGAAPEPLENPESDTLAATEVVLTSIPLGLGFETVANAVLTIAVAFVALGIMVLSGFVFWRMYRRRVGN